MFRGLALPVGLRRNQSAALEFSRDNFRLIGVSEGRSVIWLFRRPHEAPRLLPSAPAANRLATDALALPLGLGARIDPDGQVALVAQMQPRTARKALNLACSDNGDWLAVVGKATAAPGPELGTVEVWLLPAARHGLQALGRDRANADPARPLRTPTDSERWYHAILVTLGALVVFLVAAAIVNQHLAFLPQLKAVAAHYVIEKPIDLDELERTVAAALRDCGLGEAVAALRSLEWAELIEAGDRERLFTERLARQHTLLNRLRGTTAKPNLLQLAQEFGVDCRSIRRDLQDLVTRGQLPREIIGRDDE